MDKALKIGRLVVYVAETLAAVCMVGDYVDKFSEKKSGKPKVAASAVQSN